MLTLTFNRIPWYAFASAVLGVGLWMAAPGVAAQDMDSLKMDLRQQSEITGYTKPDDKKLKLCTACHGKDGLSIDPHFPNLASQSPTYLYVQLKAYEQGVRHNKTMDVMIKQIDDDDMRSLSMWYAAQSPSHAKSREKNKSIGDAKAGAKLYHAGDPQRGIPSCQGCHGPGGAGPMVNKHSRGPQPAWSTFPRLAAQNSIYVVDQLKAFKSGERAGSSNTNVMHGVVKNLDEDDMQNLAEYILSLKTK